jgi:hypothetical protein
VRPPPRRPRRSTDPVEIGRLIKLSPLDPRRPCLASRALYESNISLWRRQRDNGDLTSAAGQAGAPRVRRTPEQLELERLRKENAALVRDKARAEKKPAQTEAA